jgi:hypothetical protein
MYYKIKIQKENCKKKNKIHRKNKNLGILFLSKLD